MKRCTGWVGRFQILVAALVIPTGAAFAQSTASATTGRIQGSVTLSHDLSVRKPRLRVYAEYGPGATPADAPTDTNELKNVVLYLDSVPADESPVAPPDLAIAQQHESFQPHVLPVLVGWSVAFPNRDPIFHNVFSLSSVKAFDLGRYPQNASKSVRFDKPGIVQVFCHIHSDMSAVVFVRPNPYFTVPNDAGHYVIDGVPPGDYRVVAWHERSHPALRHVHVEAGEASVVDFNIPLPPPESRP
jgi:plastocyanin